MMNIIQTIFKSKTLMFALILAIFGVVEMNVKVFSVYMTPQMFGFFSIGISVIVAILRIVTTLPLDKK
jgi:hypothetical protein